MPDLKQIKHFRERIIDWGSDHQYDYPWRRTRDPYKILVSEFMLHRTQARQVLPIYEQFMLNYPSPVDYVKASEAEVDEVLSSLGLNWRIQAMKKALHQLWSQYRGIPADVDKLSSIDGIGQYIAGATVCFSENTPLTLIDTNVVRVIGRVFGIDLSGEARRRRSIIDMISICADPVNPRKYYYGIIDLAHHICKPKIPRCQQCPLVHLPCAFAISSGHKLIDY